MVSFLGLDLIGFFLVVEWADWLSWVLESWILWIDERLSNNGNAFVIETLLLKGGEEFLNHEFTKETLAHSAANVEWHSWDDLLASIVLEEDGTDLWTVAVSDNELVAILNKLDELLAGAGSGLLLVFEGSLLAALKKCIAAKSDNNLHFLRK